VKRGRNDVAMKAPKTIAARFYQITLGYGLLAQYLRRIGKERNIKCWWCGHEYHTRNHLFKSCNRLKNDEKWFWINGQEGEVGFKGVEMVMKKPKICFPMSLAFAEEKCSEALMDFSFHTDLRIITEVVEQVQISDHKDSSNWGCEK